MTEQIGEIAILHGSAFAEGPDGIRELSQGSPIYNNDTITTASDGALEIKFTDGALLSQGADSKVHLDDYIFDPSSDAGELTMNLIEGTFRSVTGQIVDINPEGFRIDTPNSTIGIRGTTTGHEIGPDGEVLIVIDFDGKPVVATSLGGGQTRIISQDGGMLTASPFGLSPVGQATPSQLSQFEELSSESLQEGAPPSDGEEEGGDAPEEGESGEDSGEIPEDALEQMGEMLAGDLPGALPPLPLMAPPIAQMMPPMAALLPPPPVLPSPPPTQPEDAPEEETTETLLDLSTHTDHMVVHLDAAPPYYMIYEEPSSKVHISTEITDVIGSHTQDNQIEGNSDDNALTGGLGNDEILGNSGDDVLKGDFGNDTLKGGDDNDSIHGGGGNDEIWGEQGNDILQGDSGNDIIKGGAGNDYLFGGIGMDELRGESGNDTFYYAGTTDGGDTIKSFSHTDDVFNFDLDNFNDGGVLSIGENSANFIEITGSTDVADYLSSGSAACMDSDDRFVYLEDGSTFKLYYDSNGSGTGGETLIATFDSDPGLDSTDIIMV
jgi:hypothetical protein